MCGIVGYVGPGSTLDVLLGGLKRLEYRGYDSAGISVIDPDLGLQTRKRAGKLQVVGVTSAGRSSLVIAHRLTTAEDPLTVYGEGYCKLVWIDHVSGRSVALPEHVRGLFNVT